MNRRGFAAKPFPAAGWSSSTLCATAGSGTRWRDARSFDAQFAITLVRLLVALVAGLVAQPGAISAAQADEARPNILWLTSEDHGPHMGCYGDEYATTPNVDALAVRGMIYTHCWSNAPVCAAARTTLISGMYAPSTGGQHMRSMVQYPAGKEMFPQLLRSAGYYCTNNSKEDYNLRQPGKVWDESSRQAHWKKRPAGQPFFAVFNSTKSHESQIRKRPHKAVHDPAKVAAAGLPSRHARGAAGLGAVLRRRQRCRRRRGGAIERTRRGRTGRRYDRVLLRRPRLGHAPQQALAVQQRAASSAGGIHSRQVQAPAARRLPKRRQERSAGQLRRLCADRVEPGRHQAAGVDAGVRLSGQVRRAAAAVHLRLSRTDGREDRHSPQRDRRPLRLCPQLHAAPDLRSVSGLHVSNADDAGLAPAARRGEAQRGARRLLAAETARRVVRPGGRPRRSAQPGWRCGPRSDPLAVAKRPAQR